MIGLLNRIPLKQVSDEKRGGLFLSLSSRFNVLRGGTTWISSF